MAFAPYVTLTDFKGWVKLPDAIDDAVITDVLNSVSRWIDEYCDRHFWQDGSAGSEVARTFTPTCAYRLEINDLVSITTLKTDDAGTGTYGTTWSASDYQLQPVNRPTGRPYQYLETIGGRLFPSWSRGQRSNRVEITGIWGWPAVPEPVKQACKEQAHRELKRRDSPQGIAGFQEAGVMYLSGRLDPDVGRNLDPYRHTVVLVA